MPVQHLVPAYARSLGLSPRAQANALEALAAAAEDTPQSEWAPLAAAAVMMGASWAGEDCTGMDAARTAHVPEERVAQQYQALADRLRRAIR